MNRQSGRVAMLACALVALCACDRAGEAQRKEEAINRGDVTAAAPAESFESQCKRAGGEFRVDAQANAPECRVTAAMCATLGEWRENVGCVLTSTAAADCAGMDGLKVVGDSCTIAHASRDQLVQ